LRYVGYSEGFWLGERGGGEGPGVQGVSSSRRIRGGEREVAAIIFQNARFGKDVALLLPNTRGQKGTMLQYHFGQTEGGVLEWSMLGFGGVSSEFELVRYRYDDECMHDAKC
jgi:hypothetical protein